MTTTRLRYRLLTALAAAAIGSMACRASTFADESPQVPTDDAAAIQELFPLLVEEATLTQQLGADHPKLVNLRKKIESLREHYGAGASVKATVNVLVTTDDESAKTPPVKHDGHSGTSATAIGASWTEQMEGQIARMQGQLDRDDVSEDVKSTLRITIGQLQRVTDMVKNPPRRGCPNAGRRRVPQPRAAVHAHAAPATSAVPQVKHIDLPVDKPKVVIRIDENREVRVTEQRDGHDHESQDRPRHPKHDEADHAPLVQHERVEIETQREQMELERQRAALQLERAELELQQQLEAANREQQEFRRHREEWERDRANREREEHEMRAREMHERQMREREMHEREMRERREREEGRPHADEHQRHIRALHEAAEILQQHGLQDMAHEIHRRAEEMEQHGPGHEPAPGHGRETVLPPGHEHAAQMLQEIHHALERLHGEIRELHERLGQIERRRPPQGPEFDRRPGPDRPNPDRPNMDELRERIERELRERDRARTAPEQEIEREGDREPDRRPAPERRPNRNRRPARDREQPRDE